METETSNLVEIYNRAQSEAKQLENGDDREAEIRHLVQFSQLLVHMRRITDALWYSSRGLALSDAGYGLATHRLQLMAVRKHAHKPAELDAVIADLAKVSNRMSTK
jgi:hypothetical protein